MEAFKGINWKEWNNFCEEFNGGYLSLSGQFAGPVPECVNDFFETQKPQLESFFNLTDEKRIEYLLSHLFITYRNNYVEETHSWGHICEDNIFSPDDCEPVGYLSIALERLHFNYLSKDLNLTDDLYESWRESVFTTWGYFYLPDLLSDLKVIKAREPELAQVHYYLAECLQCPEQEDLNSAIESYKKFLELSKGIETPLNNYFISENFYRYFMYTPSFTEAYFGLARIFLSRGDLDAYEEYLLKSIGSDKYHHISPYLELAYFYIKSGKTIDALKYVYIYEDVFEARVRSFDFAEEFFAGHDISRSIDDYVSSSRQFNCNYYKSDCLEINYSRLWWRFRKYPYLSISLSGLDNSERKRKGHKNLFQVSYRDVRTLIDNFCMNIMCKLFIEDEQGDFLNELFERVRNKKSYTWECFPDLKRFDEGELIELRLQYLVKDGSGNYEALKLIKELLKKGPVREEILLKYKNDILKESPFLEKYLN